MKVRFCVVTQVAHKIYEGKFYGYAPYVKEMNIWTNYVDEVLVIAPLIQAKPSSVEIAYSAAKFRFIKVPEFNTIGVVANLELFWKLPYNLIFLFWFMFQSDHIHLRCPGNMGLLGTFVQIFFPKKKKTAKYAGNWDWNSEQPWSYRLQQRILRNTFLTRNMTVLAYGNWNETRNIKSFFTASYSTIEIGSTPPRRLEKNSKVKLLFVGALNKGKRPMLSLESTNLLLKNGLNCELNIFGDGAELDGLMKYCETNKLRESVLFHGNVNSEEIKKAYQESHFLIFASKSEGWPKVVAESMFWGCLPITTAVSCVPEMLGNGLRGDLVEPNVKEVTARIEYYLNHPNEYEQKCEQGMKWSREFTLEKFETEIRKLLI